MDEENKIFNLLDKIIELEKTSINNVNLTEKARLNTIEAIIMKYIEDED